MRTVLDPQVSGKYSESEICVGHWINGEPLYRKVFKFTVNNGATVQSFNTGVHWSKVVRCEAYVHSANTYHLPPYVTSSTSGVDYFNWYITASTIVFRASSPGNNNPTLYVIMEYVK